MPNVLFEFLNWFAFIYPEIYLILKSCVLCFRNDEYEGEGESKNGPETYDGPAGMNPDGIIESNWDEVVDNFDNMKLKEELLRGIYAYGFEKPSAIQQRAIMPCVKGLDVIAQAQSGAHVLSYLTN